MVLKWDKIETLINCGCVLSLDVATDQMSVHYCPLHAAAPLTLAACKTALYYIDLTGDGVSSAEQNAKVALRAAIAAAEPVSEAKEVK